MAIAMSVTTAASAGAPTMDLRDPLVKRPTTKAAAFSSVNVATGTVEALYTHCDGVPLHGPNDIVFDSHGGFWFTDFGKRFADRLMLGALYYARTDGSFIRRAAFPLLTPNGVGLSPDERTLYVA